MSQTIRPAAFSAKDPGEIILLAYDFVDLIGASTLSAPVVTATVSSGTDPTPSAILSGSPSISGSKVLQRVQGGVAQVTYSVRFQADASDGSRWVEAGLLPVRSA